MLLHMITDRARSSLPVEAAAAEAARAGADVIHVRETGLSDAALLDLIRRVADAIRGSSAELLVNDRFDLALAAGAAGVHLKSTGIPTGRVRSRVPFGFRIGRSVHTVEEARLAEEEGADTLLAGPVFETPSKAPYGLPPLGLDGLGRIVESVRIPVIGVGGMSPERVPAALAAGAAGVAAIGYFCGAAGPGAAAHAFRSAAHQVQRRST